MALYYLRHEKYQNAHKDLLSFCKDSFPQSRSRFFLFLGLPFPRWLFLWRDFSEQLGTRMRHTPNTPSKKRTSAKENGSNEIHIFTKIKSQTEVDKKIVSGKVLTERCLEIFFFGRKCTRGNESQHKRKYSKHKKKQHIKYFFSPKKVRSTFWVSDLSQGAGMLLLVLLARLNIALFLKPGLSHFSIRNRCSASTRVRVRASGALAKVTFPRSCT